FANEPYVSYAMIDELITKYSFCIQHLEQTRSSRKKLAVIINFFRDCERLNYYPPDFTFIEEFVPLLISIFRNTNVNFIDPEYINSAKQILTLTRNYYDDDVTLNEINTVISLINMQLLKMYFYLGEFEEGLLILNRIIEEQQAERTEHEEPKPASDKHRKNNKETEIPGKFALVNPDVFKKSRAFEILDEIKFELDRLNSYSQGEINTILVEEDFSPADEGNFGLVQTLYCKSEKSKKQEREIAFSNITDLSETDFANSLNRIRNAVKLLLYGEKVFREPYGKLTLSYGNYSNIYKGTSFLFAGSVLSFCTVFNERNGRDRYLVSSSAAFTGSIDERGNLIALPSESL
ncbi:MAG: hypothetical protein L0Y76_10880, partial [Ignavibacteria bacterium]|nr:hypothetical protein [Ignavibacteria bacterium]